MQQLCNAAYAAIVEFMGEKEKELFDRKLVADDPQNVSHGTAALLALMGGIRRPPGDE